MMSFLQGMEMAIVLVYSLTMQVSMLVYYIQSGSENLFVTISFSELH